MTNRRTNPVFLNGVPELLILHLLAQKPMYGYELVQTIRATTEQAFEFGEGCIYPILHRLEADGMLLAKTETVAGRNRVTYRVTENGRKQLANSVASWEQVVKAVSRVLQGGENAQPALA